MRANRLVLGVVLGLLVLGIGSYSVNDAFAAVDSKGKEFLISFLPNLSGPEEAVQLHITGDMATSVTVNYPVNSPTFTTTVDITPGQITIVDLPLSTWKSWSAGIIQNNSVLVESPQEVTVYTTNLRFATSDAGLAIPSDANSFKYIVTNWEGGTKQFAITAISDNTKVTINPKGSLTGGFNAGVPFEQTLDRGEGFLGISSTDLTGTTITSDKPITMTYGNQCVQIPPNGACDHIYEHGIPVQGWGKTALVGELANRPDGNRYAVTASEDNTQISLDGSVITTINEGEFYRTGLLSGKHEITANKPIFTTEFLTGSPQGGCNLGDPAMTSVIPPEQFLNQYTFATTGGSSFFKHFLGVTVANSDVGSFKLDGVTLDSSMFSPIGSSGFSYGLIDPITEGTHTTFSPNGHGLIVGGFGFCDSYLYPGGAAFEFINPQPEDDRDGDGVLDINDECPDEFAETENGCPLQCEEPEQISTFYDFNDGAPEEFSGVTTTEPIQGYDQEGFSGDLLRIPNGGDKNAKATLTLTDLPEHDLVDIKFLLAIIDSWDGEPPGGCCNPDIFNVFVDGVEIFSDSFGHNGYEAPPNVQTGDRNQKGFNLDYNDVGYNMGEDPTFQNIPHNSTTITIEWFANGAGLQGVADESWGIDNVQVITKLSEPLCPVEQEPERNNGGDNQWDTRPTFGISHEDRANQVVDSGFSFNGEFFTLTDNHHTDFAEQSVEIGTTNSFSAKVYADKKLKVQEFLFGIPNVGEAHLAELGVEVWYDRDGNIEDVKVVQKSDVIDAETVSVSHEKTKCLPTDPEPLCDTTTVSMTFLEPLADKVMAIKAIDYALRDQRTFLNEGFDISGDSLNPMASKMIPSNQRDQGLLKVTQLAKYSPYWKSDDGRMFEINSFGSFKEINQTFERFQDTGDARNRLHSGFGGIIQYEQDRALDVFDASQYKSELPESFAYIYPESGERITDELLQQMLLQEEIAKAALKQMDKQNRHY